MQQNQVTVAVPARLHLGFLDLHGGLGRRFGSLGITVEGPRTRLRLEPAAGFQVHGPERERVEAIVRRLADYFGFRPAFEIRVEEAVPAHSGLGSGTQLALAVGAVVARHLELPAGPRALARILDRGARSGISLGAFEQGGVLLDGGRGAGEAPPPIIARLPFPPAWRLLLIQDLVRGGVHGSSEVAAFEALSRFPEATAARLARLMIMQALPALAEQDYVAFCDAVGELQYTVGDHFAPAQGGRFASPAVSEVLEWLAASGLTGIGQSSWGPTGFALLPSETEAARIIDAARARWPAESGLGFRLCEGRNQGAICETRALEPEPLAGPS